MGSTSFIVPMEFMACNERVHGFHGVHGVYRAHEFHNKTKIHEMYGINSFRGV